MNDLIAKEVNFLGDTILATQDAQGNIWAGVSYICKGIGLNKNEKDRQIKNVQIDEVLSRVLLNLTQGYSTPIMKLLHYCLTMFRYGWQKLASLQQ